MNIRFKSADFEFQLEGADPGRVDRVLASLLQVVNPESSAASFLKSYNENPIHKNGEEFVKAVNGIRELNGVKLYQCSYSCGCGNRGKRYIRENATKIACHKCRAELSVQRAVATEELTHDSDFDYFVAY